CLRLWQADDPESLFYRRGVQGVLEDYVWESLERFPDDLRYGAIALLGQMVTSSGTRNVISAQDLIERVRLEEGDDIPEERLEQALEALEGETRLVRRERRRDLYLYEITSEFLVPWIARRREELIRAQERIRERRKLRRRIQQVLAWAPSSGRRPFAPNTRSVNLGEFAASRHHPNGVICPPFAARLRPGGCCRIAGGRPGRCSGARGYWLGTPPGSGAVVGLL
ncbi:MAG TPA: hypothetical protein VG673_03325, partial [Actinomycetota bacterium]|nr:hypothetical protein [Actinomycetota bacterium]